MAAPVAEDSPYQQGALVQELVQVTVSTVEGHCGSHCLKGPDAMSHSQRPEHVRTPMCPTH